MLSPAQSSLYWRLWGQVCQVQGWPRNDRDKRMEVHAMCLAGPKSTKMLSNTDIDCIFAQFRLLIDPDNIDAQAKLDWPAGGRLKRVLHSLGTMPAPLVQSVCRDKFDLVNWRTLDLERATQLLMTVKRIIHRKTDTSPKARTPAPSPVTAEATCPF